MKIIEGQIEKAKRNSPSIEVRSGLVMISVLLLFTLFSGLMSGNLKFLMSVVPFVVTSFVICRSYGALRILWILYY